MMIDKDLVDKLRANQPLSFEDAFQMMKYGIKMKRGGWHNLKSIKLVTPTEQDFPPYFEFVQPDDTIKQAHIAIQDMLMADWLFVD